MTKNTQQLANEVEALLFVAAEPLSYNRLQKMLAVDEAALLTALDVLEKRLVFGVVLVKQKNAVGLATNGTCAEAVEKLLGEDEGEREIGPAGLEVLSILLYKGPRSKATIDYIRGVNSASTLRTLLYRGLIERGERIGNEILYRPTVECMAHLGITAPSELPQHEELSKELEKFMDRQQAEMQADEQKES